MISAKAGSFTTTLIAVLLFACSSSFGEERAMGGDRFTELLTEQEAGDMRAGLETWTDDVMLDAFRGRYLTEDDLKGIYREFSEIPAWFPRPGLPESVEADDPAAIARKTEYLGRKVHNIFLAMPDDDLVRYGKFLGLIREVLFFDADHMRKYSSGDMAVLRRWSEMHAIGLKEIEREYIRIAITAWGGETEELDGSSGNGPGTATLSDGSVYEGDFSNGLFNGKGVRTWKDGHKYEGEYKDGLPHGKGVETWSDGMRYEGEFREGQWYGKGVVIWKDGRRYEVENR